MLIECKEDISVSLKMSYSGVTEIRGEWMKFILHVYVYMFALFQCYKTNISLMQH